MRALDLLDTWPVDHASAAVVTVEGVVATRGDPTHRYEWASVTKLVTALATLVAVEEETVTLDDDLRRLLSHATTRTRRTYSNEAFERIAEIVAGAAAMPFADYACQAVLEPLGMGATDVSGSPAAGAVGPVDDLAALARELLAPTIVSASTLHNATSVQFPGLAGVLPGFGRQDPNDWGLGFELRDDKSPHWMGVRNSPATFGHFGRSGGFLWVDPRAGIALACLTDRPFGSWAAEAWPVLSDVVLADQGRLTPKPGA